MKYRILYLLLACLLGITSFVSCQRMHDEAPQGLTIHLSQELFTKRVVRAPSDNSVIKTLDVVFIDNTGKVVNVVLDANGATNKRIFRYGLDPVTANVKWKNNDRTTNTLVLTEVQYHVFKDVKMFVLANLSQTVHDGIANGTLDTQDKIKEQVSVTLPANKAHDLEEPFLLTGETATFSWDGDVDKEVPVDLKRAVAAVDIIIHYQWEKLDPEHYEGGYKLKEFDSKTFVGEHYKVDDLVDSDPRKLAKTTPANPTSTISFYLNEYDFTKTGVTGFPPYILLALPKVDGAKELPGGLLPPPIGEGLAQGAEETYYRIVMPPTIQRNYHYTMHVYINEAGSNKPEGATPVRFQFSVKPWDHDLRN